MKTLPVYTILWVASFLIKYGQPAPHSPSNLLMNTSNTKPKSDQLSAISDILKIRVKRNSNATNATEISTTKDISTKAESFNGSNTGQPIIPEDGTSFNTLEETTPFSSHEKITLTDTTKETTTNAFENVTLFDIETTSVNAPEETTTSNILENTTSSTSDESTTTSNVTIKSSTEPLTTDNRQEPTTTLLSTTDYSGISQPCKSDSNCKVEFSICKNNKCVCQEDYYEEKPVCKEKIEVNAPCEVSEACRDLKAYCGPDVKKCICYDSYFVKNNKCIKKKSIHEECETKDKCQNSNAHCSAEKNVCVCSEGYRFKDKICKRYIYLWWLAIVIGIIVLLLSVIAYFCLCTNWKASARTVTFMKLKSLKTTSHKRPYKIKNFLQIDSKTFIHDYKIIGKVNPFILTQESDLTSNNKYLPCHEAQKLQNKKKNRFLNVLPFDHSRVKLDVIDDDPFTDYINANYISGYNQEKEYIACQGPLIHTVDDFWRMVWQENINLIVMLTLCEENGKHKCYQYWPKKEKLKSISRDLLLETDVVINHEYYNESNIIVNMDEDSRIVKHLHFLKWPDFSATVDPKVLTNFIKIMRSHFSQAPILIHCSAGVGRTGTMIAVDYMLQYIRDHTLDDDIDIFSFVYKMRENRPQMVQNQDQYILINNCIKKAIMEKYNLKEDQQTNKEEVDKKEEIRVDIDENEGDTEKETETDIDDTEDSEDYAKKLTGNVTVEEIVVVNTSGAKNTKNDKDEDTKDNEGIVVEENEIAGDMDKGEDNKANSNEYTKEYGDDADERVPLTQRTSEL